MESLFTCSPHSITPFTRSQLTSFPTTGYSIPFSALDFFVRTRGHFDCAPQHFSHSPAHLFSPLRTHTRTHVHKHDDKWKSQWNTVQTWPYRPYTWTQGHALSKLPPLWNAITKAHILKSQGSFFFSSVLFSTIETVWKDQQGDFYCSNQPSLPLQSQHSINPPFKVLRGVYRQSGAEHLFIYACECVCGGWS